MITVKRPNSPPPIPFTLDTLRRLQVDLLDEVAREKFPALWSQWHVEQWPGREALPHIEEEC